MMERRRWLITGTRHGRRGVEDQLDRWARLEGLPSELVVGDAQGVDQQARDWARSRWVHVKFFEADWKAEGRAAGPKRNQRMVDHCDQFDLCLAFPDEQSRGTRDCYERACGAGLQCVWHGPDQKLWRGAYAHGGTNP